MEDAEELVRLRNQERCQVGLKATSPEIERQRDWLAAYAIRSAAETERYYVICSVDDRALGAIRFMDTKDGKFRLGSWVVDASAPLNVAVQSMLLAYEEIFVLGSSRECRFEVQRGNDGSLRFHPKFGAQIEREDEREVCFLMTRQAYLTARPRYQRWLLDAP